MNNVGICFRDAIGTEQDYQKAVHWFSKAAAGENASAQCSLGYAYESGQGVAVNMEEAVRWYKKAAEQGLPRGIAYLGECYENGQGGLPQDFDKAVELYRKAIEDEQAWAMLCLGRCYEMGRGVDADQSMAVYFYRRSAKNGVSAAKDALKRLGYNE